MNKFKLIKLLFDKKYENKAAKLLIENDYQLSVAESCTGGLLSSLMTDVSGSSAFIKANFVTYANEAKAKYLGVSEKTLEQYGAVSFQTAHEMVEGLLNISENTQKSVALATTGIAGPTGGSKEKPVGLVFIGYGTSDDIRVVKYNVNPKYPRILIKYMFAKQAVKLLCEFLEEIESATTKQD